jgi:hypothetical protein
MRKEPWAIQNDGNRMEETTRSSRIELSLSFLSLSRPSVSVPGTFGAKSSRQFSHFCYQAWNIFTTGVV